MSDPVEILFTEEDVVYSNSTEYDYEQWNEENQAFNYPALFYLTIIPISCFVGLTGNCLVFILIRTNQIFRRLPSSPYLLALATCSSVFLISVLSFWIEENFFKDKEHGTHSILNCKFSTFFAHFCDFASVWLIVLVGFERLTLLYKATRFERSLTNSRRQVLILLVISFICNFWILFLAEVGTLGHCDLRAGFEGIYNILTVIEVASCMVIPSVFIIVSNVLVIVKLHAHMKKIPVSSVSFNANDIVYSSGPTQTIKSSKISKASLYRLSSRLSMSRIDSAEVALRQKRHSLRYADVQLTRSLTIMTSTFICLNLPNYLYRIGNLLHLNIEPEIMQNLSFFSLTMLYLHHGLLFFIYIFNSPQMRKRLVPTALKLLECYCLKTVQDSDHPNY